MPRDVPGRSDLEGHRLTPAVMVHLFRGELGRSDTWRTRLDTTTNWALTVAAAVISFSFASRQQPHATLLVGVWLVLSFLMIEARRYRYYDLWIRRVRLMEDGYWAPLMRDEPIDGDALRELANDLDRPLIRLSLLAAVANRVNRSYGPILLVTVLAWFVKVNTHPVRANSFAQLVENARVGPVPGLLIVIVMIATAITVALLYAYARVASPPVGEMRVRPRSHRLPRWERVLRPYAIPRPRTRARRITSRPR